MICFRLENSYDEVVHRECGLYHTSLPKEKSAVPVIRHKKTKSILVYLYLEFAESYVLVAAMEVIAHESHLSSAIG